MGATAMTEQEKELTVTEVAERLHITYRAALRRIEKRLIRARREGKEYRVKESDLARYIEETYLDGPTRDTHP